MRRIWLPIIIAVLAVLFAVVPALALPYSISMTVTNTNSTAFTNLPVIGTFNTTQLVSNGYLSASGLDLQVKQGSTILKSMLADDKLLVNVPSLPANNNVALQVSTGNTPAASMPIIVGVGGYVTTADAAKLEPGDNFTLEISLDLRATQTYIWKQNALKIAYNASTQTLTAQVGPDASPTNSLTATGVAPGLHLIRLKTGYTSNPGTSLFLYPTGPGDYATLSGATNGTTHWSMMASFPPVGTYWNWGDYHYFNHPSGNDLYAFTNPNVNFSGVVGHIYGMDNFPTGALWNLIIKMPGRTEWRGLDLDPSVMGGSAVNPAGPIAVDNTIEYTTNPITGVSWTMADLDNIQFGINSVYDTGTYAIFGFAIELKDPSNLTTLALYVDNMTTPVDSADLVAPVPDNSNNWIWYPNPYINYVKLSTGN